MPRPRRKSAPPRASGARSALFEGPNAVEDVVVGGMRLGIALASVIDRFFQQHGLTTLQFNVLRILYLRDPERVGLPSGAVAQKLVSRVPDVPRLIDRLVQRGLLERVRSDEDRRVVRVRLTPRGIELVEAVHEPLLAHNRAMLADVPQADLARLASGLQRVLECVLAHSRSASESPTPKQ